MDKRELQALLDAGRTRMFRETYLAWGRKRMALEFADAAEEDAFVEIMRAQVEAGSIAQHFYNEGDELMVYLEVTEKGERTIAANLAKMN